MERSGTGMTNNKKFTNLVLGLLLFSGVVLRITWSFGGPGWAYWLSNLVLGTFFFIPGLLVLLAPKFAIIWMQPFTGTILSKFPQEWEHLRLRQKLLVFAIAFMNLVIGLAILLTNIYRVVQGCTPIGDCPGL